MRSTRITSDLQVTLIVILCTTTPLFARPQDFIPRRHNRWGVISEEEIPAIDAVKEVAAGPLAAGALRQLKLEENAFKEALDAEETGYNSCEMCVDFDGKGQCITMTEGQSKQSICLPNYAREDGCAKNCGRFMLCKIMPLLPHGNEFKCKMPKPTAGNKLYKVYNSSTNCPQCSRLHHLTPGAKDKTPGCLLVDGDFACIKPQFYAKATVDGTCDDALCPKYSRCFAKEDNGGKNFLLKCMFDPKLLPKPPPVLYMKKAEKILESIAENTKATNDQMKKIIGKKKMEDIDKEVEDSLEEKCPPVPHTHKAVPEAEPVMEDHPLKGKDPIYRHKQFRRTKRDTNVKVKSSVWNKKNLDSRQSGGQSQKPQFPLDSLTCLMEEKAVADHVAQNQMTQILSKCKGGGKDSDQKLSTEECDSKFVKKTQPDLHNLCIIREVQKHQDSVLKESKDWAKTTMQQPNEESDDNGGGDNETEEQDMSDDGDEGEETDEDKPSEPDEGYKSQGEETLEATPNAEKVTLEGRDGSEWASQANTLSGLMTRAYKDKDSLESEEDGARSGPNFHLLKKHL